MTGSSNNLSFYMRIDHADSSPEAIESALLDTRCETRRIETRGLSGVSESLLVISVATQSVTYVIDKLRRMLRRGVIIDATRETLVIRGDPSLPKGMVVVRSRDGDVTVEETQALPASLELLFGKHRSTK